MKKRKIKSLKIIKLKEKDQNQRKVLNKIIIHKSITNKIMKKRKKRSIMIIITLKEKDQKEGFLKIIKIIIQKRKIYLNIEFKLDQEKLKNRNPFKDQEIININTVSIYNNFHTQKIDLTQEILLEID